jgi:rfaE bifunctional protein nucleotidyltransferase chain/domain
VANAMGVWRVPEDRADGAGKIMASFRRVSHCYRRPAHDDWPYQLYTMIHGRSRDECEEIAAMMAREAGVNDYRLLYSGREFKKTRVRYFVPAFDRWAERFLGPRQEEVPGKPAGFADLRGMSSAVAKIRSRDEAATVVKALKDSGRTSVFANGCFDVLHAGHVRFLDGARALGDVLIVGINTDSSVRALKGAGRPLLPEEERAALVASLRSVDHVVLFHETTADALLRELQPDIHAKGTDYTEESVPERETVLAYGGRVAIVGDPKDHSTRGLIRSLQDPSARGDGS